MKFKIQIVLVLLVIVATNVIGISGPENTAIDNGTRDRIIKAIDDIWLIDTHEHLITEKGRMQNPTDLFYLVTTYIDYDLLSSGMTETDMKFIMNPNESVDDRWYIFQPYWEKARNTGYAQCLRIAVKDLFGIDDINSDTYQLLHEKVMNSNHAGWYKYVLKDKARIDVSIIDPLDRYTNIDHDYSDEYFVKVKRFDDYIKAGKKTFTELERQTGIKISSLTDYLTAVDRQIQIAVEKEHIAGIKSTLAYSRTLFYKDVPQSEAEIVFNKSCVMSEEITTDEAKKLQDFMMHHIVQQAAHYNLPIQIHTGILAGNWRNNPIENTNACLLSNLFLKYKQAKFVIFHGSYPYMGELAYLAKSFPNVYIDMCWMDIISPAASKRWLEEWLFTVPANKIMAFGGDIGETVEMVYGHAVMARRIVADVLIKMAADGYYKEAEAISIAGMILRSNALELYGIKKLSTHFTIGD